MLIIPGLIDPHVHLRTPGQEYKEDFFTSTSAALAGGFTTILDMPNNLEPITTLKRLETKQNIAQGQIVCDIGFYFGSMGDNFQEFKKIHDKVFGLKIFLNQTTGNFVVNEKEFENICNAWPVGKPILIHAEENILEKALEVGNNAGQKIHVCHISNAKELQIVIVAKMKGYNTTCGVTPHHLFLNNIEAKKMGSFGKIKPALKPQKDVDFLWNHLRDIDVIESDHAPHTIKEKESNNPPSGVPGLETTLPLLLTAVHENKITINDIQRLCHDNPSKIFLKNVIADNSNQSQTYIEIEEDEEWVIKNDQLFTKCKWSPFNGWKVKGKIKKVVLRNKTVFENEQILADKGSGEILVPTTIAD